MYNAYNMESQKSIRIMQPSLDIQMRIVELLDVKTKDLINTLKDA